VAGAAGGLEAEGSGGAGLTGGAAGTIAAGGGATAAIVGLCRHPILRAIALIRSPCGSARSHGRRSNTLLNSATVVQLLGQFSQSIRGRVQRLRGVLPQLRHYLVIEIGDHFLHLFFYPRQCLVEPLVHFLAEIFESATTSVTRLLVHNPSLLHLFQMSAHWSVFTGRVPHRDRRVTTTVPRLRPEPSARLDWNRTNLEAQRGVLTNFLRQFCLLLLICLAITATGPAQTTSALPSIVAEAALPDAPQAQTSGQQFEPPVRQMAILPPPRRYAQVIEPGQTAQPFTPIEKVIFSFTEIARPITLIPALYSATYEQIFQTDPKYGNDSGAYGEKIGAALLRRATLRIYSDGIFASAFHQDPRYYRVASGSIVHRSLLSARQAFVRRSDDGVNQFNYSGIIGRAASAATVLGYYPSPSRTAKVVGLTFATSIASDMGGNLVLEFLPNIIRKFPVMQKLRLE
jgi:hypothetical protein